MGLVPGGRGPGHAPSADAAPAADAAPPAQATAAAEAIAALALTAARASGARAPGPGCDDGRVSDAVSVTDHQAASRFEISDGGHLAELRYHRNGNRLTLIHTEVPVELEGRGFGGRLVTAAVDRAAREGLTIVPFCPFARRWLESHADVADQVTIDWPAV